jgi:DNA mismatch endonuclease (patch repair protein)
MADPLTRAERSALMAKVRSKGNLSTEMRLVRIFRANGITGWRRNRPVYGKPDFIFTRTKLCVFVDGCFWHGCPKCYRQPKSRKGFWSKKVRANQARDRIVSRTLRRLGYKVLRIRECEMRFAKTVVSKLNRAIASTKEI